MILPDTALTARPSGADVQIKRGRTVNAMVLLAGAVRLSELQRAAGRPILDLPLAAGHSLGRQWLRYVRELRREIGQDDLPLIITANATAGIPTDIAASAENGGEVGGAGSPAAMIRMDSEEPRGSGGALRDYAMDQDPAASLLVASAHCLPRAPLGPVLARLAEFDDDVVIHTDADDHPTGIFLIRCAALQGLPAKGFVDLKEQALPQLAAKYRIRVVRDTGPSPIAIRTLRDYLSALRVAATAGAGQDAAAAEDWQCTFAVAEDGAIVDPSARLHDSVVLRGARIGARATVVRSLIGPDGSVPAGAGVFDDFLPRSEQNR